MTTCLVIDDVMVTRFVARALIEEVGINVIEAEDGESALKALDKGGVDVVLLDWHLKKKSGIELLKVIRKKYGATLKVVMFSGVEDEGKEEEEIAAGANGFITKPTTKEKIEGQFRRLRLI